MNARTMKRSIRKAKGLALSKGPRKGTTGQVKGPARTPNAEDVRQDRRNAMKAARAAEVQAKAKAA